MPRVNEQTSPKSPQLPNLNRPTPPVDRYTRTASESASATNQAAAALASTRQSHFSGVQAAIERIATNRNDAVEQVSDVLAYLNSKETFEADVMRRTAEKLGLQHQKSAEVEAQPTALDDLAGSFATLANSVKYPAVLPHTVAGALPM